MPPLLSLEDMSLSREGRPVVTHVSLELRAGECVGLIGPNGAGKTSLLRAALGLVAHEGRSSLAALSAAERARAAGYMPQAREVAWPVTVEHLVALGRLPHLARGARLGGGTAPVVQRVLAELGLLPLASRAATTLSGGELARVLLARVLVQETPLILADEPAAGLDPAQAIAVTALLAARAGAGQGVLMTLHDLGLAARYCTRLVLLAGGRLIADGPPRAVLTPQRLAEVFGIRAHLAETPDGLVLQPVALA